MVAELQKERLDAVENAWNSTDDDSDPEADRLRPMREENTNAEYDLIQKFIVALPSCILFTLEFDHNRRCFCPCGEKMKTWRGLVECDFNEHILECGRKSQGDFKTSDSLIAHLRQRSKQESTMYQFHTRVLQYLRIIYPNRFSKWSK
jgi:hypothetical protein